MKSHIKAIWMLIVVIFASATSKAQDVRIVIPVQNIINGVEFNTTHRVLNTGSNNEWRQHVNPTMTSANSSFTHTDNLNTLPLSVLHWQLESIGGNSPIHHQHDEIPDYQFFSTSPREWFRPKNKNSNYTPGEVVFKFRIPAEVFTTHTFIPGEYAITINHNYASGGSVIFTPSSFRVILVIPSTLSSINWVSNNTNVSHEISSLHAFRATSGIQIPIGTTQIANMIDFNLWGKTNGPIQIISSNINPTSISPQHIKLGSTNSVKISTLPLSESWENYTANDPFTVIPGNVNTFDLNFFIENEALKTYFFQTGTYTFQLNMDAKSTDNSVSSIQGCDITINVLPLSEITILSEQEVNFNFNTASDYQQGKSKIIPNQIMVSNNENFELYIKSDTDYFKKAGIQSDINTNILEVGVNANSLIPLSTTPQKILENGTPVLDRILDVKYNITPAAAQSLIGKEKTTYSVNLIYSFTAQ